MVLCSASYAFAAEEPLDADDNYVNPQQVPDSSFLYDTNIHDLNNADISYNNEQVRITGEVVGDRIASEEDPGMYWITLNGTDSQGGTISVLMSEAQANNIDSYGSYGSTGTIIRVKGTFHLACSTHEGIMDIHADTVSIVQPGKSHPDTFDATHFIPGVIMIVLGAALALLYHFLRERDR